MPEKQKREFTGVWIPAKVIRDQSLSGTAKLLLAEIACYPACFMSNKHLAEVIGASERQVQRHIKNLKEKGYVEDAGFDGRKRFIRVTWSLPEEQGRGDESVVADTTEVSPIDNNIDNNSHNIEAPLKPNQPITKEWSARGKATAKVKRPKNVKDKEFRRAAGVVKIFQDTTGAIVDAPFEIQKINRLIDTHGEERVIEVLGYGLNLPPKEYQVVVRTPDDLARKWPKIVELMNQPTKKKPRF